MVLSPKGAMALMVNQVAAFGQPERPIFRKRPADAARDETRISLRYSPPVL